MGAGRKPPDSSPFDKLLAVGMLALGLVLPAIGAERYSENLSLRKVVPIATWKDGVVRGLGAFQPIAPVAVPPCLAHWKPGKNTRWVHFSGDNRVTFPDGRTLTLPEREKIEFFENDGPRLPDSSTRAAATSYFRKIAPGVSSWSQECLSAKEPVWVEGCVQGEELVPCKGQQTILLTAGGAPVRAAWFTGRMAGGIALGALGVFLLTAGAVTTFQRERSTVIALARRRGISSGFTVLSALLIASIIATISGAIGWASSPGPWILTGAVGFLLAASILLGLRRMRLLSVVRRLLVDTRNTSLASAPADVNELAVRIPDDVSTVEGFRPSERHAVVKYRITERYVQPFGQQERVIERTVAEGAHPRRIAIEDASGRGLLDLAHCELDVAPETPIDSLEALPQWIESLPRSPQHVSYQVQWSVAAPGESLLIYGGVERVMPPSSDGQVVADYRQSPECPMVAGLEEDPIIAFVGDEQQLLAEVRRELLALSIGVVLWLTTAGVAGFALHSIVR